MRGRRIAAPAKSVMRPTQERVREALFSMLADRIRDCHFLDLFAGSGIVALEAWSRGAASVTVVEKDRRGCLALQRAVERLQESEPGISDLKSQNRHKKQENYVLSPLPLGEGPGVRVGEAIRVPCIVCADVARFLEHRNGDGPGDATDIVFADPPYQADGGTEWVSRLSRLLSAANLPRPDGGLWIMETSLRQQAPVPEGWEAVDDRQYGETRLMFYRRAQTAQSGAAELRTEPKNRSA